MSMLSLELDKLQAMSKPSDPTSKHEVAYRRNSGKVTNFVKIPDSKDAICCIDLGSSRPSA